MEPQKLADPAKPRGWKSRLTHFVADALPSAVLVSRGSPEGRRVAFTFDDGPDDLTDTYLDLLARYGVRATFFVIGRNCVGRRDALLRIVAHGHELAGHGFTHDAFTKMSSASLRDELARTAELLPPARTERALVRPPRGATSVRSLAVTAAAGYTTVLWSRDSDDCRTASPDEVAARMAPDAVSPGEIILLHEGQRWTLDALPMAIERLTAAGYELAPAGELIEPPR